MKLTWSYTMLSTFEECPRKFHSRYILKEKEPPSPALEKGREIHKQCEDYLRGGDVAPFLAVASVRNSAKGKKLAVEQKMGLNGQMEPVGFFEDNVWGRGAADVIILDDAKAFMVDWKTGKVREKEDQLAILSHAFVFPHYPRIQEITACNIFLEHGKTGAIRKYTRDQSAAFWQQFLPRIERMEKAVESNSFSMMPGPLCSWCHVSQCPNNRR